MKIVSLNWKLRVAVLVVIVLAASLSTYAFSTAFSAFRTAHWNAGSTQAFAILMDIGGRIAAERGPASDVMSLDPSIADAARARLARFRVGSDEALASVPTTTVISERTDPLELQRDIGDITRRLDQARMAVDRLSAMPLDERRTADLEDAIDRMIGVSDAFRDMLRLYSARWAGDNPEIASTFMIGRMLAELREYGGRAASQLLAPVATREPIGVSHRRSTRRTLERLSHIWSTLSNSDLVELAPVQSARLMSQVEERFFGQGLDLIRRTVDEGATSADYTLSGFELTQEYLPLLKPVDDLRRTYLAGVISRHQFADRASIYNMLSVGITSISMLMMLGIALYIGRRRLVLPVLQAGDRILALAQERAITHDRPTTRDREIQRLFDSIFVLEGKLKERREYALRLKTLADEDGLTGTLNRRALNARAAACRAAGVGNACLLLVDIDFFKRINDTHGHLVGDVVIVELASLLERSVDAEHSVARFGGEEFAILMPGSDLESAGELAETLRGKVEGLSVVATETPVPVRVTVSIGIACGQTDPAGWQLLQRNADRALYKAKSDGRNVVRVSEG